MRTEEAEGRVGLEGAGKLSQGNNRGKHETICHNRQSHFTVKLKSGTSEMSSDLQE